MRLPSECRNMAELRVQIDRLDRQLIALLAERAGYIDRAAQLKPAEGLPARIGARVNEVKANVRAEAVAKGLDPDLAEGVWSQLIDWSIAREEKTLGRDEQE
ncbi:chorismate mutase [Roseinatronobacter thiooxidans]|nr:chorismate mutase [Roseinatronobacter thiooxidans]